MKKDKKYYRTRYLIKTVEEMGHLLIWASPIMGLMAYFENEIRLINDAFIIFVSGIILVFISDVLEKKYLSK